MIPYFDLTICTIVKTNNRNYSFEIPLNMILKGIILIFHDKIKIQNEIIRK